MIFVKLLDEKFLFKPIGRIRTRAFNSDSVSGKIPVIRFGIRNSVTVEINKNNS